MTYAKRNKGFVDCGFIIKGVFFKSGKAETCKMFTSHRLSYLHAPHGSCCHDKGRAREVIRKGLCNIS